MGVSAWQTLVENIEIANGQKILIHGGAGGIGSIAIQVAKHLRAYVATTVSPICITPKQRSEYLNALEEGNKLDYVPLIDFIISRMNATLLYLSSRPSILKIIKSEGYKKFFLRMGDEVMYNQYVRAMEIINSSGEFP